jgi:hypothetical protein
LAFSLRERQSEHALDRRRREGHAGGAQAAGEEQLVTSPPKECPMMIGGRSRLRIVTA